MVHVRAISPSDLSFVREELIKHWGSTRVWSIGRGYPADQLPGFIAEMSCGPVGLVTYSIDDGGYQGEVVTLSSRAERQGIGAALLDAAVNALRQAGCTRAFLCTTNDNTHAIRFYQKRGWRLAKFHKDLVTEARRRVPSIPSVGHSGIEIRDEIELEMWLRS